MVALDHRREIVDAAAARTRCAGRARFPRNSTTPRSLEPDVRHDRVEHELRHVVGMCERVPLADVRPVRDAVERDLVDAERLAKRVDVGDDVVGAVELPPRRRSSPRTRGPRRPSAGRDPTRPSAAASPRSRAHRRPVPRWSNTTIRYCPFSAASALSTKRSRIGRPGWPGPPESTSSTPRGALTLSAAPTREVQRPLAPAGAVERHVERRARVAGDAGARRRVAERRAARVQEQSVSASDEERHARDSERVLIERVLSVRKLGYSI